MPGALAQQLIHSNTGLDTFVKFYCPMVGANGGTTFSDLSASAHTITRNAVTTSTAQSKFDGSSASFNGSTTSLVTDSSADFDVPGDFTVDFWLWSSTTGPTNTRVFATVASGGNGLDAVVTAGNAFRVITPSADLIGTANITNSTWHHIAVARSGTALKTFVDGVVDASGTSADALSPTSTLVIGAAHALGGNFFTGNIQMFRFSKGVARWTANFTPPAIPFS